MRITTYVGLFIGIFAAAFVGRVSSARAATDFMTSWQAKTYVPAWYIGKAMPAYQSFITVGFELIDDGKIADLSKTIVRWYIDDKLFKNEDNGVGIKKVTVYNQKYGGDVTSIKISIPNYKGVPLERSIDIPVKDQEVVIDVPFFDKRIPKGDDAMFAWPFFFNAPTMDMLGLQWNTPGSEAKQAGNILEPLILTVGRDIPQGTQYEVGATIGNLRKNSESATKSVIVETR